MKSDLWEFFIKQGRFYWYWFYVTFVVKRTIRTTVSIYFFVVRNLYGSAINLKNTTGRKTAATTAPSRRILHSIHCRRCCCCCCCWCVYTAAAAACCWGWGCGPFLFTVKTLMFDNKFFKFRFDASNIKENQMDSLILSSNFSNCSKQLSWECFVQFEQ